MFATFRRTRGSLPLALAALAVFAAALWVVHIRHRPSRIAIRYRVPEEDKMDMGSRTAVRSTRNAHGQFMTLDPTGKFLINSITDRPAFITGDTAWSLQAQLSDEDIELYLSDRASRGFNLIWIGLAENYYSNHPPRDFYGRVPFDGADFTNQNEKYWFRLDHTINRAAERGITVLADPAFVGYDCKGTEGGYCQSYRNSSTEVLTKYGEFLGSRYKGFPNIIWLIGGDADPEDSNVQSKLYALAKGIKSADPAHLMTTESSRGTSSADVWSDAPWLDLNALYLKPTSILAKTSSNYQEGIRPIFMLEDWYEGTNSITELEVRKEGYWAVLSGSTLGRVFGNHAIWNFTWTQVTTDPWKSELGSTGSIGQALLGRLFRSREHWKLVPDANHTTLTAGYDSRPLLNSVKESIRSWVYGEPTRLGSMASVAARTADGQTIIAYVPSGSAASIAIDMSKITDSESKARCWWFNPRDASTRLIGSFPTTGTRKFTPPDENDWVLVIDSLAANLAAPGSADL